MEIYEFRCYMLNQRCFLSIPYLYLVIIWSIPAMYLKAVLCLLCIHSLDIFSFQILSENSSGCQNSINFKNVKAAPIYQNWPQNYLFLSDK